MQTVSIGRWELDVPFDWHVQDGTDVPYLEADDGTQGCYIKAIIFGQAKESAAEAAAYLQDVYERNFRADPQAAWKEVDRGTTQLGAKIRSVLDLFDPKSNYRVLSVVLATEREAIHVSIHDYACEDYLLSKAVLAPVAASLRGPDGEV